MTPRVALVTCGAFPRLYEDDLLLVPALAALGLAGEPSVWNDPAVDWSSFAAIVIRSPWDYFERVAEFRAWLQARVAGPALLCNSGDVLTWNFDKRYLEELARAGVSVVPTVCVARGENLHSAVTHGTRRKREGTESSRRRPGSGLPHLRRLRD